MSINVTRSSMPGYEEYCEEIKDLWESRWLTNMGAKHNRLKAELCDYLKVPNTELFVNGHLALYCAIKALGLKGEIITTPFTFASTTNAIVQAGCVPVFCDVADDYTIDVSKIEGLITDKTSAILGVHVYGNICDVEEIDRIAKKHGLKVIYDAAHAFGSRYKGQALCAYGDISTLSFHATKLFHTIEGGACIIRKKTVSDRLDLVKRFGHLGDEHFTLGINAKQDEFNAAMGNVNLNHIEEIIAERKRLSELYDSLLPSRLRRPSSQEGLEYNYA